MVHPYIHIHCTYSGTSNNGHSEERTTSLQRTICVSPADNRMHSIHFYLRNTDTSNLRITDKPHVPNGHPAYKITSDNGQRTLRTRGNAEKCIYVLIMYKRTLPNLGPRLPRSGGDYAHMRTRTILHCACILINAHLLRDG